MWADRERPSTRSSNGRRRSESSRRWLRRPELGESESAGHEVGELLGGPTDLHHKRAGVLRDASREREEREAQSLGSRRLHRGWEHELLHGAEHVVGQQREAKPRGVRAESTAGEVSSAKLVLHDIVNVLDGARLLPVPPQELCGVEIVTVGHDGQMLDRKLPVEVELQAPRTSPRRSVSVRRSSASRRARTPPRRRTLSRGRAPRSGSTRCRGCWRTRHGAPLSCRR